MKSRYLVAIYTFATLLLAFSHPSVGSTLLAKDLESLTDDAEEICTGQVLDAVSFLRGGRIYTLNRIEVTESLKGARDIGEIIEVVTAGGHSELFSQKVFGAAELEVRSEYLLFLEHRAAPDIAQVVGMTQGALRVSIDGDGATRVLNPPKGLPRLISRDAGDGRFRQGAPWLTEARPLDEILSRVRAYIGGEK